MEAFDVLRKIVIEVVEKFEADEAAGYRSRDRQYAIDVLRKGVEWADRAAEDEYDAERGTDDLT